MKTPQKIWPYAAIILAAIGTVGSLYLSIGLGLKACPLCFYQRTFMMSVLAVLTLGLLVDRSQESFLCLLSLPLAVAGLIVAAFHEYLVISEKLECPAGMFGLGTAPFQSLAWFIVLTISVALGIGARLGPAIGGIVLGSALAAGCVTSAPPMPSLPAKPYDQPLEICRPPFRPSDKYGEQK